MAAIVAVLLAGLLTAGAPQTGQEVVAQIQVQGNLVTSDEDVRRLAGVSIGMSIGAGTVDEITARLRQANRFERVEVRKRFASLSDPTQIALVIIVDEGRVHLESENGGPPRAVRSRGPRLMFAPILRADDGYGLTYGARLAIPDAGQEGLRLSFPLTWGGEKRAAAELDRVFDQTSRAPITRLTASASIDQRTHPFYESDEDRTRVSVRAERALGGVLRVGATGGWQAVSFLGDDESFLHGGVDATVDTRIDPDLARNAVYARAAWMRYGVTGSPVKRTDFEGRGYIGLFRQNVLVVRALRSSGGPEPPFLKAIFGGSGSVRGFRAGSGVGDTLVAGTVELRAPITSPLSIGRFGVSLFGDVGTVYNAGQSLGNQPLERGFGAGIWLSAAVVRLNVSVAHGVGGSTRVHVTGGLSF